MSSLTISEAPVDRLELSSRTIIEPGDFVRLISSKKWGPISAGGEPLSLPGLFRVVSIIEHREGRRKPRIYLEVRGAPPSKKRKSAPAGSYLVLVRGSSYLRFGVRWRPFKVKKERFR